MIEVDNLKVFEEIIGHEFKNKDLLKTALTHSSYANEMNGKVDYNERLEFLGDSVLGMITAEFLFSKHPEMPELFKDHLVGTFGIRSDYNDLMIRCTSKRGKVDVPSFNTTERNVYDVTIDNDGFARYKGEINIITKPLPMDPRVNVIGNAELSDVIVESLKRGRKFKFGTK